MRTTACMTAALLLVTPGAASALILSQSTDQATITSGNSVACNSGSAYTDNSYFRVFDLSTSGLTGDVSISSVRMATELTSGGPHAMKIRLYRLTGTFVLANLTKLGVDTDVSVPDETSTFHDVAVVPAATIAATEKLVVEMFTPAGAGQFFVGSNAAGESAPGYIAAAECGITEPTTLSSIGFPGMNLLLSLTAKADVCGDGVQGASEACDDGNPDDGDGCDSNCTVTACGNGVTTAGEACDDGNLTDGDGCDSNCAATACGNGVITAGEVCDDGNLTDGDGCDSGCTVTGCGNGVVSSGETCDDGNLTDGDGCDSSCTVTACGNGIITAGEACDDGNLEDGDGCSSACVVETTPPADDGGGGCSSGGAGGPAAGLLAMVPIAALLSWNRRRTARRAS